MVSGISHQNGCVALVISVSLDPTDHEPLAAGLITRATLPIYFQVLETNILRNLFIRFRFHLQHSILGWSSNV